MKKILVTFLLIFVTSCRFSGIGNVQKPIDSFDVRDKCPYVCWMGISPNKTTAEEAKRIVDASNQIDHNQIGVYETGIFTVWANESETLSIVVNVYFENGVVSGISFAPPHREPFITVGELINLLGAPSLISISTIEGYDGMHALYTLYFQSTNTIVYVNDNLHPGPDPSNIISGLELNTQLDMSNPPSEWPVFQPWLGYGHLKDYLSTLKSP